MKAILTVTQESETQDLTIVATVKSLLGITDSSQDAKLGILISQASALIAKSCNRVFGLASLVETFYLHCSAETLMLSRYPLVTLTSVVIDGTTLVLTDDDASLVEVAAETEPALLRRLVSDQICHWTGKKVVVTYTAGYTLLQGLPSDLEQACIALVRHLIGSSNRDPYAKRIEIPDVMTTDYWVGSIAGQGGLPPEVEAQISGYRNMRLA
jgi:hypothetical protein